MKFMKPHDGKKKMFVYPRLKVPSGKLLHNYGKSPFLVGKSSICMEIFHSYVTVYQRVVDFGLCSGWFHPSTN